MYSNIDWPDKQPSTRFNITQEQQPKRFSRRDLLTKGIPAVGAAVFAGYMFDDVEQVIKPDYIKMREIEISFRDRANKLSSELYKVESTYTPVHSLSLPPNEIIDEQINRFSEEKIAFQDFGPEFIAQTLPVSPIDRSFRINAVKIGNFAVGQAKFHNFSNEEVEKLTEGVPSDNWERTIRNNRGYIDLGFINHDTSNLPEERYYFVLAHKPDNDSWIYNFSYGSTYGGRFTQYDTEKSLVYFKGFQINDSPLFEKYDSMTLFVTGSNGIPLTYTRVDNLS